MILAGRSQSKIQPLIDQIKQEHQDVKISFVRLDLGSQKVVRAAAGEVKSVLAGDKIDILILNAAIMACPYALTEDGIESQFGTNQVGHFLFTNLLLREDLVRSRVVVVSSSASERNVEYLLGPLEDITYNDGKSYNPIVAYGVSKAAMVLYVKRLAKLLRTRGIAAFSLNPGSIKTNLQVHMTGDVRNAAIAQALKEDPDFKMPVPKNLQQGAATQLRAALDPALIGDSGAYLDDCQIKVSKHHIAAEPYEDQVWKLSEQLVGEKFDF